MNTHFPETCCIAKAEGQPTIRGDESDEQLRQLAIHLAENCNGCCSNARCPFRVLGGHYCGSLKKLVNGMRRSALLSLFNMELEVRQQVVEGARAVHLTHS